MAEARGWKYRANDANALEVDFGAFDQMLPQMTLSSSIGNGLNFISKFAALKLGGTASQGAKPLVDYLLALNHQDEVGKVAACWKIKQKKRKKKKKKKQNWLRAIINLSIQMQSLMISETLNTVSKLQTALIVAEVYVSSLPKDTPYEKFESR